MTARWEVTGMSNAGRRTWSIGNHFNVIRTVILCLLQRYVERGNENDRPMDGRLILTTRRDDRLFICRAKDNTFTPA